MSTGHEAHPPAPFSCSMPQRVRERRLFIVRQGMPNAIHNSLLPLWRFGRKSAMKVKKLPYPSSPSLSREPFYRRSSLFFLLSFFFTFLSSSSSASSSWTSSLTLAQCHQPFALPVFTPSLSLSIDLSSVSITAAVARVRSSFATHFVTAKG